MKNNKKYWKNENKYWEEEEGEVIEIGKGKFLRCYDKAGKLQFGFMTKSDEFIVEFVIDRKALCESKEGLPYLQQVFEEWQEWADENDD